MKRFPHMSEELGYDLDITYGSEALEDVEFFGNKKDPELIISRSKRFQEPTTPVVGDFVIMQNGEKRRLTYDWGDDIQTTCGADSGRSDNFYLSCYGSASYSGGLDHAILKKDMVLTGHEMARFWCFHNDHACAHNGMSFWCKVRVWKYTP